MLVVKIKKSVTKGVICLKNKEVTSLVKVELKQS
jgi:hypothetical protein